jgi:hypothetical protein
MISIEQKLERHRRFWAMDDTDRPLIGFTIGDYFPCRRYQAAQKLLACTRPLNPEDIETETFLDDYERLFEFSQAVTQDCFYVAEPFTGLPWMEAVFGCAIRAGEDSFWADQALDDLADFPDDINLETNPWYRKYMEFSQALTELAQGRFMVGQPILRGPTDVLSALRGHQQTVLDMCYQPEKARQCLETIGRVFKRFMIAQQEIIPDFHGGRGIGFYYIWAPGKVIWLQEDASALLSPKLYADLVAPVDSHVVAAQNYNLFHLHPSSFFIIDQLIDMDSLKVIQINKDVGGPSVEEMLPVFKKVLAKKQLVVWGEFDDDEITLLLDQLPAKGLMLHLVAPDVGAAQTQMETISTLSAS